jgi:hypothetical protein
MTDATVPTPARSCHVAYKFAINSSPTLPNRLDRYAGTAWYFVSLLLSEVNRNHQQVVPENGTSLEGAPRQRRRRNSLTKLATVMKDRSQPKAPAQVDGTLGAPWAYDLADAL